MQHTTHKNENFQHHWSMYQCYRPISVEYNADLDLQLIKCVILHSAYSQSNPFVSSRGNKLCSHHSQITAIIASLVYQLSCLHEKQLEISDEIRHSPDKDEDPSSVEI